MKHVCNAHFALGMLRASEDVDPRGESPSAILQIAKENKCTARRLDEYLRTIISSPIEANRAGIEGENLCRPCF